MIPEFNPVPEQQPAAAVLGARHIANAVMDQRLWELGRQHAVKCRNIFEGIANAKLANGWGNELLEKAAHARDADDLLHVHLVKAGVGEGQPARWRHDGDVGNLMLNAAYFTLCAWSFGQIEDLELAQTLLAEAIKRSGLGDPLRRQGPFEYDEPDGEMAEPPPPPRPRPINSSVRGQTDIDLIVGQPLPDWLQRRKERTALDGMLSRTLRWLKDNF